MGSLCDTNGAHPHSAGAFGVDGATPATDYGGALVSAVDSLIAGIARRQHGTVTRSQLLAAGVSISAIRLRHRDGRLRALHAGVYATGPGPLTRRGRWLAAVLAVGAGAVLSHRSAAALLDLRPTATSLIDVTVPGGSRRRRRDHLRIHTTRPFHPDDATVVDGIPVTSVERTLLDLAVILPLPQLRRAHEQAERLRCVDHTKLRALLARSTGRRGLGALRRVAAIDPEPGTRLKSELEQEFRDLVEASGLPAYLPNTVVAGYEVDAYWPAARLVVELQSRTWHTDPQAFERDHAKRAELMAAGDTVLALTYEQVTRRPKETVHTLRRLLFPLAA